MQNIKFHSPGIQDSDFGVPLVLEFREKLENQKNWNNSLNIFGEGLDSNASIVLVDLWISSHGNKKASSSFYHKKYF